MARPLFTQYTNLGTPTSPHMALEREPVVVGRYYPSYEQPTIWTIDLPLERVSAREKLEELVRMPENWDGYGAVPIRIETTRNALRMLEILPDEIPMPDITPNPNGTVSFEWESPAGIGHLEIGRTRCSFSITPRHRDRSILRDWRMDEPGPNVGELVIRHLYSTAHYITTITDILTMAS